MSESRLEPTPKGLIEKANDANVFAVVTVALLVLPATPRRPASGRFRSTRCRHQRGEHCLGPADRSRVHLVGLRRGRCQGTHIAGSNPGYRAGVGPVRGGALQSFRVMVSAGAFQLTVEPSVLGFEFEHLGNAGEVQAFFEQPGDAAQDHEV
jgi:hypothetical protein